MSNDTSNLNFRQKAFVDAYIASGYNATKAAIDCGYSKATARQQGSRLLKRNEVQEAIRIASESHTKTIGQLLPKRIPCYLYLMLASNGLIKIGIAHNPHKRLSEVNANSPIDVDILCIFPDMFAKNSETELHILFSDKRIKGEWFSLDGNDVEVIRRRYGRKQGS